MSRPVTGWRGAARAATGELLVSEIFGPTIQGEGPATGRTAAFLRLGGCNLTCSWCDTPYTWDAGRYELGDELTARRTEEVAAEVLALGAPIVVVTGGEPLLQRAALTSFAGTVAAGGAKVHVETNGTVGPGELARHVDLFVVSPKTSNSGVSRRAGTHTGALAEFARLDRAVFKFVVSHPGDLVEIDRTVAVLGVSPARVWAMPEGTDATTVLDRGRWLVPLATSRGWSVSTRLHVLLWGNERGR